MIVSTDRLQIVEVERGNLEEAPFLLTEKPANTKQHVAKSTHTR